MCQVTKPAFTAPRPLSLHCNKNLEIIKLLSDVHRSLHKVPDQLTAISLQVAGLPPNIGTQQQQSKDALGRDSQGCLLDLLTREQWEYLTTFQPHSAILKAQWRHIFGAPEQVSD